MQLGELRINVELYTLGISLLSRVLRTRVTNSDRMPALVPHTVLTIPLIAVVAKPLPVTGLLDRIVEEGRLGPAASKPEAEFENLQAGNKVEPEPVRKPSNRPDTGEFTVLFRAEPDPVPKPSRDAPLPVRAEPASPPIARGINKWRVLGLSAIGFLLLMIVVVPTLQLKRPIRPPQYSPLPAIGTAVVTSDSVPLFAGPSTAEKQLAVLRKGSKVNILRMPKFPHPEWMEVQQVGDMVSGYVGAPALGGWSTFALMRLFDPGDFSDLPQRIEYLEALRANIAGFPKADQDSAWLEIARQDIAIARDKKASSVAQDNWQINIGEAREALAKVSSHQSMAEPSKKMQQEIVGILEPRPEAAPRATTTPPAVIRKTDTAADYRAAEDAYRNGQYAKAIQLLKRILNVDNHNQDAKSLLEKVEKAEAEEITPHQ